GGVSTVFSIFPSGPNRIAKSFAGLVSPLSVTVTVIFHVYIRRAWAFAFADWPNSCAIAFISVVCADATLASDAHSNASAADRKHVIMSNPLRVTETGRCAWLQGPRRWWRRCESLLSGVIQPNRERWTRRRHPRSQRAVTRSYGLRVSDGSSDNAISGALARVTGGVGAADERAG